jgi:hypothetical protein
MRAPSRQRSLNTKVLSQRASGHLDSDQGSRYLCISRVRQTQLNKPRSKPWKTSSDDHRPASADRPVRERSALVPGRTLPRSRASRTSSPRRGAAGARPHGLVRRACGTPDQPHCLPGLSRGPRPTARLVPPHHVSQLKGPERHRFDALGPCGLGDRRSPEHLTAGGLRGDPCGEVDRGTEHVIAPFDRRPVVEPGSGDGEAVDPVAGLEDLADKKQSRGLSVGGEEYGIAERLDEPIAWAELSLRQLSKMDGKIRGYFVAHRLGQGRDPARSTRENVHSPARFVIWSAGGRVAGTGAA